MPSGHASSSTSISAPATPAPAFSSFSGPAFGFISYPINLPSAPTLPVSSVPAPALPAPAFGAFQINCISSSRNSAALAPSAPAPLPMSAFTSTFAANPAFSALPSHIRPTPTSSRIPSTSASAFTSTFAVNLPPAPPTSLASAPSAASTSTSTSAQNIAQPSAYAPAPPPSAFISSFAIHPPPPPIGPAPSSMLNFSVNLDPSAVPTPIPSPPGTPPPYPIPYNYPEDPQPVSFIILSEKKLY